MPDRLLLHGLAVDCRIGVFERERQSAQTIWIDLELAVDARRAAARDDVSDAVDYARLVTAVKTLAQRKPYALLETLAEDVAVLILRDFETPRVLVRAKKRALPGIDYAAVEVERTARSLRAVRRTARRRRRLTVGR